MCWEVRCQGHGKGVSFRGSVTTHCSESPWYTRCEFPTATSTYMFNKFIVHRISCSYCWKSLSFNPQSAGPVYMRPGPRLNIKTVFPRYGIPMLKIRRSKDCLIFNIGIIVLVRHLYIESRPLALVIRRGTAKYKFINVLSEVSLTIKWFKDSSDDQIPN